MAQRKRGSQQRRAAKAKRRQARKSSTGAPPSAAGPRPPALPELDAIHARFAATEADEFDERDWLPECPGMIEEHIDGTEGNCARGARCTGGYHSGAIDCASDPEDCTYCRALICRADVVVEHRRGARTECNAKNGLCEAPGHENFDGYCDETNALTLTTSCGACQPA
ncbi:hypothetical protein [Amycolatopsis sp. lyj-23]|uniref:hypothetical protein n=1 Tax=Amycolatopsis sp. lyj-23 TaxID=2789283 RepID=UPI00397CAFA9